MDIPITTDRVITIGTITGGVIGTITAGTTVIIGTSLRNSK